MSKSLKNFVSIEDYMLSKLSDQPAVDFRIYCLQNRYSSALHFSEDRIYEAKSLRHSLENSITMIRKAITSSRSFPSQKPSTASTILTSKTLTCSKLVDDFLRDDVNTPEALRQFLQLLQDAHQYAILFLSADEMSLRSHPIEPLIAIDNYTQKLFNSFGLEYFNRHTVNGMANTSTVSRNVEPIIDALVNFRSSIRANTIQASKSLTKLSKLDKTDIDQTALSIARESVSSSMKLCDELRDVSAPSIGIRIEDMGNKSIWRLDLA